LRHPRVDRLLGARRQAESRLNEIELTQSASSSVTKEMRDAMETWKGRAEAYLAKLENAEVERVKAAHAEAYGKEADTEASCI
jgi:myosin heavy chain 9/10/11/14